MPLGGQLDGKWRGRCAENIVNIYVFVRFPFWKEIANWRDPGRIWDALWSTLGTILASFGGSVNRSTKIVENLILR